MEYSRVRVPGYHLELYPNISNKSYKKGLMDYVQRYVINLIGQDLILVDR